jgi:hypothetical protein
MNFHEFSYFILLGFYPIQFWWSVGRDSSFGIATRYGLDGPVIEFHWGTRYSTPIDTDPGPHPASSTLRILSFPKGLKR